MRMHRFEGATMRDAIAKVKAELGDQAVIISTRQVRKGLLGTAVEISAAIDDDTEASGIEPLAGPSTGGPARYAAHAAPPPVEPQPKADLAKLIEPLRSEMKSLRAMVRAKESEVRAASDLKAEVAALKKLLESIQPNGKPPAAMASPAKGTSRMLNPLVRASTSSLVMLIGPTGAGKTTTIAKLAATAALVDGRKVRIVTLDNYRVGGVEQVRTFANLIGVPLVVLQSPRELSEMLANDVETYDLTLVDTAGTSPREMSMVNAIAEELPHLSGLEVHLVVPATSSATQIDELAHRYSALDPARLLFTKLDEVPSAPELAKAPLRLRLPITWVTTGQAVPEDLEQPTHARVLELSASGLELETQVA